MEESNTAGWNWTKSVQLEDGTQLHILRLRGGVVAEATLARIYLSLADAKLLQVVFPGEVPSLSWWLNWMSEKNPDGSSRNVILACFVQRGEELIVAGFGSIGTITALGVIDGEQRYKSEIGFAFLPSVHRMAVRSASGKMELVSFEFGDLMLDFCFEGIKNEVVYGTTPKRNVLACRYAERVGLEVVGVLPIYGPWMNENGTVEACDYQVAALTREKWAMSRAAEKRETVEA